MAVEAQYHIVCDGCRNYAGWTPSLSITEAAVNARRLGWTAVISEGRNYAGEYTVQSRCPDCK